MVVGATGRGKSYFSAQLAATAALGGEFLSWPIEGGRTILILDAEQGVRTIQKRLVDLGVAECDTIHLLSLPTGAELDKRHYQRQWLEEVLDYVKPDILIADPNYKLFAGDSNDEQEVKAAVHYWDLWRSGRTMEYRDASWDAFNLLLPMHARKDSGQGKSSRFSMDDTFGSTAWLRGAEVVVGIELLSAGMSRLSFFKDRDGDGSSWEDGESYRVSDSWNLTFEQGKGFALHSTGGGKMTTADHIRAALADGDSMTYAELTAVVPGKDGTPPASERTIKRACAQLLEEGHIVDAGKDAGGAKRFRAAATETDRERWEALAQKEDEFPI